MMDLVAEDPSPEQRPTLYTDCLDAAEEVLEEWEVMRWGVNNPAPLIKAAADLDSTDEEKRAAAHESLELFLTTEGGYVPIACAISFMRLDRYLDGWMASWEAPNSDTEAMFKNSIMAKLGPDLAQHIPRPSDKSLKEHTALSNTVDLEAQIAHAAYLVAVIRSPESDEVARFRAAAKLLSYHIPLFALRRGQNEKIADACFDVAFPASRLTPESTPEFLANQQSPDNERRRRPAARRTGGAYGYFMLSDISDPYALRNEHNRMRARESHLNEGHLTLRSQLEMLHYFPKYETVLQKHFRVEKAHGKMLVVPAFHYELAPPDMRPDFAELLDDENLPEVYVMSLPEISVEDMMEIIRGCDPILLDAKAYAAFEEIINYPVQRHEGQTRGDGTTHMEGHISPFISKGRLNQVANGDQEVDLNVIALAANHDTIEDVKGDNEAEKSKERQKVIADLEAQEKKYGLNFMPTLMLLTKQTGLKGEAADGEQAHRISASGDRLAVLMKFDDKDANATTDERKALRRWGFTAKEDDYWGITNRCFGEMFQGDDKTRALWRITQKVFNHYRGILPLVEPTDELS